MGEREIVEQLMEIYNIFEVTDDVMLMSIELRPGELILIIPTGSVNSFLGNGPKKPSGILKMREVNPLEVKSACSAYHSSLHYLWPRALVSRLIVI